jgi:acyl-CoA synthetase (AMP-forming)/AMP-acid ligase II
VIDEITMMISVPAVFAMLVQRPPSSQLALRLALYGGAPISTTTVRALQDLVPGMVAIQGYGMTEMSSLATALPRDRAYDAPGSVGIPSPITQLRIVGERGDIADDELGEILLNGPNRTPGYLGMPEATAAAIDRDGWYHTGDIGWRDPTGLLYFAGRKSQLINRGGEKVSPREIESALCEVEGVAEAVAFGLPHQILGEVPAAAIVPIPGALIDAARVEEVLEQRLASFKRPTQILTLDTIPLAVTGKPDLALLRGMCEAG